MWKKILLVLAVLIAVLAVVIQFQSDHFSVERSTVIAAPASAIFPHVNDFHQWTAWSPWEKVDPTMTRTYEGPTAGKGAKYLWSGKGEAGQGDMTIIESTANERIAINLHFAKPMDSYSEVEFTLAPHQDGTKVTWKMSAKKDYFGKAMGLVMNMEKYIGDKYEEGLNNLKGVATSQPPAAASPSPTGAATPTPAETGS